MANILVVDDEDMVRSVIRQTLAKKGFDVREARNGTEAVRMYKADPADLVITDIIMPDKEGIELIIELKAINPDLKIIAMSGGGRTGSTDYLALAREFGAEYVFEKPFDRGDLVAAVMYCFEPA